MNRFFQIRRTTAVLTLTIAGLTGALTYSWLGDRHARAASYEPPIGSFAPMVKRAMPAVVNISSSKMVKTSMGQGGGQFDDPFFRQFFGDRAPQAPREQREHSLGSGVVVSSDGYILTNSHVVDGATDIKVSFTDHHELSAKIIGNDKQTDVAVIKVDAKDLPVLPLSDSSRVEVGDVVLAIGNPLGLGQTVTMGIVSATGRAGLGIEQYEDFIQTDAAINPGNSGGALINTRGELIGINTAILSGSGGNQGIGFAIPVNLAKNIREQLEKNGKVTRGFIGIMPQEITPDMAKAFNLPENQRGIAIASVSPGTPASKAGLQTGDVITALNGKPTEDVNNFRLQVASFSPGTKITLSVLRDGHKQDVDLTLAVNLERGPRRSEDNEEGANRGGQKTPLDGVQVDELTAQVRQQLKLPVTAKGVVVTEVDEASQAARVGLQQGDVIEQVNRKPVSNPDEFEHAVEQSGSKPTLLLVNRGGASRFVVVPNK